MAIMFKTYSQKYNNPNVATVRKKTSKQKTIKGMFETAREKVG